MVGMDHKMTVVVKDKTFGKKLEVMLINEVQIIIRFTETSEKLGFF